MYFLYSKRLVSSIMTRSWPDRHALCRHRCIWRAGCSYRASLGSTWCHFVGCRTVGSRDPKGPLHTGWPASEKSQVGRPFYDGYISCEKDPMFKQLSLCFSCRFLVEMVDVFWMIRVNLGTSLRIMMMLLVMVVVTTNSCHLSSLCGFTSLGKLLHLCSFEMRGWIPMETHANNTKASFLKLPVWLRRMHQSET